jgi:methylmalonyl-CoA mutase C-terminal domain/subunit
MVVSDRVRVLITKPTHDCHDRGARYLTRKMRDAGFEVIFMSFLVAEEIVATAVEEDVDVIGISSSSGGHMPVFEDLLRQLKSNGLNDVVVLGGGIIPPADARALGEWGVDGVFGPGSSAEEIVDFIKERVAERKGATV